MKNSKPNEEKKFLKENLALLQIKNLNISTNSGNRIIQNFSMELFPSEIFALVGASGSGKSTIGMAVLGILDSNLKMQYESFQIFGKERKDYSSKVWKEILGKDLYFIPQNPILAMHPYLTVGAQIEDHLKSKKINFSKEEIFDLFDSVGIKEPKKKWESKPSYLSGGERQRIFLVLCKKLHPKIIIADEPTTALDSKNEKKTLEILMEIVSKEKISVILISHDQRLILELANRGIVLKKGEILENFTNQNGKIFNLKHSYSVKLLGV